MFPEDSDNAIQSNTALNVPCECTNRISGRQMRRSESFVPDVAKDAFVKSEPAEGAPIAPDGSITVYYSSGQVQLTDLKGQTEQAARDALTALGLTPNPSYQETDQAEPGTVISQDPGVGPVAQHSTVSIVIAQAKAVETTAVPSGLEGKTYGQAQDALGQVQLNAVYAESYDPDVPSGKVIKTDPPAGTTVDVGTNVTVVVSLGPDPGAGGA